MERPPQLLTHALHSLSPFRTSPVRLHSCKTKYSTFSPYPPTTATMQTVLSRSATKAFVGKTAQAPRPVVLRRAEATESAIFDPKGDGYECEFYCCPPLARAVTPPAAQCGLQHCLSATEAATCRTDSAWPARWSCDGMFGNAQASAQRTLQRPTAAYLPSLLHQLTIAKQAWHEMPTTDSPACTVVLLQPYHRCQDSARYLPALP